MNTEAARLYGAYVYGSGNFSTFTCNILRKMGICVHGLIDYKTVEENLQQVIHPLKAKKSKVVFLGFHNYQANIVEITNSLLQDGFLVLNVVDLAKLANSHNLKVENYWLTNNFNLYLEEESKIETARALFKDKKSQDVYNKVLSYRNTGNVEFLDLNDGLDSQYFPSDLPWIHNSRSQLSSISAIDGGAFKGETYDCASKVLKIEKWIFVEPDPVNVQALKKRMIEERVEFQLVNKALHNTPGTVNFSFSQDSHSSSVTTLGNEVLECTTIDVIAQASGIDISLIKLDVEGSEVEAIEGAVNTIQTQRPYLAIAVYHKPEDHWNIPLHIVKHFPFYDIYLRLHGEQTFDVVLYCVPK